VIIIHFYLFGVQHSRGALTWIPQHL